MKYIIAGLGSFGSSLGMALTSQGHEVIAIDSSMQKVEAYKEAITHTICMDATDEYTVNGLPIMDTDIVVVAIGENEGANIMATALFKTLKAKRLISRSINPLHEKVLQAIGVDDIFHPEKESAMRWAKRLSLRYFVDSFELTDNFSIVEKEKPFFLFKQICLIRESVRLLKFFFPFTSKKVIRTTSEPFATNLLDKSTTKRSAPPRVKSGIISSTFILILYIHSNKYLTYES